MLEYTIIKSIQNMELQTNLEELKNACAVCGLEITKPHAFSIKEDQRREAQFCSDKCYKKYIDDPGLFSVSSEDEALE
jgi:uncharacterized protein with PIN domain